MDSTERHVTSQTQKAARATVPERNRQPSPRRRHSAAQTPTQRSATRSIQKPLAHAPLQAQGHGRQQPADSTPCVRSSSPERASHEIRCSNAQQTPGGQPPHEAAGGKSNRTPKAIPAATDPDECKGSRPPITMAELDRTLRLLPLGLAPGPDEINGEALRHLGRVAKHAVPRLFNRRLRAGTVPRNRRRMVVIPLLCNPGKTAYDRDPPPTCNDGQLP
ncbi:beta prime cop protein [Trypanosoma cruzi]|nr:beta prime cop protein [Trypanosoma cruzi]